MVNPSWNRGVLLSETELICLLNDDLAVNLSLLYRHAREWFKDPGLGMVHFNSRFITGQINWDEDELGLNYTPHFGHGYGCLMILRRLQYLPIPEIIKVFYGDDWLRWHIRHRLHLQTAEAVGLRARGSVGFTSDRYEKEYLVKEGEIFKKICELEPS